MIKPAVRFLVCSDVHYEDEMTSARERFEKFVQLGYELAERCSEYPKLDAVYICGDFTDFGTLKQFSAFQESLQRVIRPDTIVVPVLGGHEHFHVVGEDATDIHALTDMRSPYFQSILQKPSYAEKRLRSILKSEPNRHEVINGFHFISVSGMRTYDQWFDSYSKDNVDWVVNEVQKASDAAPHRPVFLFHHRPIAQTIYGERSWGGWEFCLPLANFPQIVDFSGHSHVPCTDPRSIYQRDFTCVGTGAIKCILHDDSHASGWSDEDSVKASQGLMVEADNNGTVCIRVIDVVEGVVRNERIIKEPWNPDTFVYTEQRLRDEAASSFPSDARIVTSVCENSIQITFPQAIGETAQYVLTLRYADNGLVAKRKTVWSKQTLLDFPQKIIVNFTDVSSGNYVIEIEPKGYFCTLGNKISELVFVAN